MGRKVQAIVVMALVVGAVVAVQGVAAANPVEDYRTAMTGFLPVAESWAAETQTLAEAAAVKPELACTAAMLELAERGRSISLDMAGTGTLAPLPMWSAHSELAQSLSEMTSAAEAACSDSVEAAKRIDAAMVQLADSAAPIKFFLTVPRFPSERPNIPVLADQ